MRRGVSAVAVLVVAVLIGASAALAGSIVRIGPGANGKRQVLHPRDTLVVSLPGNATTGYSWRLRRVDRTVLKVTSSKYIPNRTSPSKVGSGGKFVFRFQALAEGTTPLRLVYVHGSLNATPARKFSLKVFVIAQVTSG